MRISVAYMTVCHKATTNSTLAHNSKNAVLSGSTFSFDSISDTFYEMISLNIDVAEITNKDVSLQRIVSRIEFMATDSVSDILKQFDMEIDGISNQLDIATGQDKNPG